MLRLVILVEVSIPAFDGDDDCLATRMVEAEAATPSEEVEEAEALSAYYLVVEAIHEEWEGTALQDSDCDASSSCEAAVVVGAAAATPLAVLVNSHHRV